jgi:hypothetical protein
MTWPRLGTPEIGAEMDADLEWRLRYSPDSISFEDKLVAAAYIQAYRALITTGRLDRENVIRNLKAAEKLTARAVYPGRVKK